MAMRLYWSVHNQLVMDDTDHMIGYPDGPPPREGPSDKSKLEI